MPSRPPFTQVCHFPKFDANAEDWKYKFLSYCQHTMLYPPSIIGVVHAAKREERQPMNVPFTLVEPRIVREGSPAKHLLTFTTAEVERLVRTRLHDQLVKAGTGHRYNVKTEGTYTVDNNGVCLTIPRETEIDATNLARNVEGWHFVGREALLYRLPTKPLAEMLHASISNNYARPGTLEGMVFHQEGAELTLTGGGIGTDTRPFAHALRYGVICKHVPERAAIAAAPGKLTLHLNSPYNFLTDARATVGDDPHPRPHPLPAHVKPKAQKALDSGQWRFIGRGDSKYDLEIDL